MSKKNNNNSFYHLVSQDPQYKAVVNSPSPKNVDNFKEIERLLRFPLRPYQLEALSAFQLFWKNDFDSRSLKQKTEGGAKNGDGKEVTWNKVSFEMATGSGKTLLMGATILYLWQKGHRDFLILTPNTILFDKTIENFTPRAIKSIFGDGWNLRYNLVTGNNYRDKTCGYENDRDISFYVFNMQKFYDKGTSGKDAGKDTMKGVPFVRRPLEDSLWRDEGGKHTISFMDFLKEKRPIIISDEAHHYQKGEPTRKAINEILPSMVLEFTATSIERGDREAHGQDNLYKYPMERYIGEGYGKRIFALGVGATNEQLTNEVTESDKQKLVWGMIVHLLKREALKAVDAPLRKSMVLTKARSIEHADNIHKYLSDWSNNVSTELEDVVEQLNREQTDLVKTLRRYVPHQKKDISKLAKELDKIAKTTFTIHSENKTEDEVWTDYKTLDDNDAEIVNQVRVFTEGIDYDNFYTIVVLGDTVENVGLAAAQLIGRGLRLYKEKREFDILEHDIREQGEILHVICEKGRRFDKIVEDIRQRLQLSQATIEIPVEEEEKENKVRVKLVDDYKLPVLNIKPEATGITFEEALKNKKLSVKEFINYSCGTAGGDRVLKPEVLALVEEVEITRDEAETPKEKPTTTRRTLTLDEREKERWAWRFIEETESFIGNNEYPVILKRIKDIFDSGIRVDVAYAQDYRKALRGLEKSIRQFHRDGAYELMFEKKFTFRDASIKNLLKDSTVVIKTREGWTNLLPSYQPMSSHLQQKGVVVEGYKHSAKPYAKLDTPPEKWVADALERLCELDKSGKSFWVRNEPQKEYVVEVRPAPFYPDFLAYIRGKWAIVDVKGKHLAEAKHIDERKNALRLIEEKGGIKTFFLVDKVMDRKGFNAQKIDKLGDLEGYDELRHEEFAPEGYIDGREKTLFDK